MSNRKPFDTDIALSCWARLTIIEQCSLAILYQCLLTPEQWRLTGARQRKATQRTATRQRPADPLAVSTDAFKRRA